MNEDARIIVVCNTNPSGRGINGAVVYGGGIARTVAIEKGEGQKVLIEYEDRQNNTDR